VSPDTGIALATALRAFDADPTVRVAVVTGKDGNFCAGFDLKEVLWL
jgi:enoyl-CoA hydratase